jgi:hypothetical protein
MNTRLFALLVSLALVGIIGVSSSTFGDRLRPKKRRPARTAAPVVQLKHYPPAPFIEEPRKPRPTLAVQTHPETPSNLRPFHGQIARMMSGNVEVIPPVRRKSLGWLPGSDFVVVEGWHGYITDSVPIPGGNLVTLRVSPVMRGPVHVSTQTIERYAVYDDGTIQLNEAFPADPDGPKVITIN